MPFKNNVNVKHDVEIICKEEFEELRKIDKKDWVSINIILDKLSDSNSYYRYTTQDEVLDCTELTGIKESRIGRFKMKEKEIVLSLYMYENRLNMNAFHIGRSTKIGDSSGGSPKSKITIKKAGVVIPIIKATVKYAITPASAIDSLIDIITDE